MATVSPRGGGTRNDISRSGWECHRCRRSWARFGVLAQSGCQISSADMPVAADVDIAVAGVGALPPGGAGWRRVALMTKTDRPNR